MANMENMAVVSRAVLTAQDQATPWMTLKGEFHVSITGSFTATVVLQRRMPDGAGGTRGPEVATVLGTSVAWTGPAAEVLNAGRSEAVQYRVLCQSYTSGSADVMILQ